MNYPIPAQTRAIVNAARDHLGISARALADEASISARTLRATMREAPRGRWLDYAEVGELRLAFFNLDVSWSGAEALERGRVWTCKIRPRVGRPTLYAWTSPTGEEVVVSGDAGHPSAQMGVMLHRVGFQVVIGSAGEAHLRAIASA